ncbi:hypothetical protein PYCCODRAFT_1469930 [Trametes coccinea BRFM310]|uniref:Uncharacterized protein n=1 Tax=Trametes coccinea (strain BRFM310) TaxID=1353009 RepID=A0A1Y2IF27_TRAC3|nr:hypothetical protein PYCCODRAFT_1469930 [Trametes coccinea BRFM310]
MSATPMSATDKLAAMKAQLAELERLAEEERRQEEEWRKAEEEAIRKAEEEARRKAEEEKRRAEEEEKRKAEEERRRTEEERQRTAELASQAIPQKRKSAHPDSEHEEDEEDEAQGEEAEVLHKPSLGRTCRFRDGPRTSSCTECQRRATPCLGAKGLPAAMQARVDRKSGDSPQRKRVKKSAPIVVEDDVEDDEPTTPTKKLKGKGKEVGSEKRSTEKGRGAGAAAGVAEFGGEGSGRVRLGQEEKEWSADLEPEQLTDRELLQHVLVEGQKMRLGMSRLLRHMEEEGELRAQWALADSKVMRQAVRKEMGKWAEEELRPLIRAEIRSVLAEFFETPAEQEEGKGQEVGDGQEGEGEGEGGEEVAPAE